ncbi:MAG TPA: gamma-glutamylcyclotransferase family protein [Roseiarcus sp.]
MPLYFAYGANMNVRAMARRCPRSKTLGPARLVRHRLAVMREGWLTVARDPRSAVCGLLWDLALADVAAIDRYEGLQQGLYAKLTQPVVGERGPRQAIVYVGCNSGPGSAGPRYIAEVIAAARSWPLPVEAIEALERIAAASRTAAGGRP